MSNEQDRAQTISSKTLEAFIAENLKYNCAEGAAALAFFLVRQLEENPDMLLDFSNDIKAARLDTDND